jgi:hypothetical protein
MNPGIFFSLSHKCLYQFWKELVAVWSAPRLEFFSKMRRHQMRLTPICFAVRVWLIVYCYKSQSRFFTQTETSLLLVRGLWCSALLTFEQGGIYLLCHTCCDSVPQFNLPFYVPLKNFSLTEIELSPLRVKDYKIQAYARRSGPSSREGSLSCHTLCDKGPRFFRSHPKNRTI